MYTLHRTEGVGVLLVLKKKGGVFLRGIDRYKSSFDVSINAYFFSNAQIANHLTPHRLINAAPWKPTFSLPHACKGILMSLVASTRQTPSILPRLVLVAFCKCNFDILPPSRCISHFTKTK